MLNNYFFLVFIIYILFKKLYIDLGKITHLSLHFRIHLFNLIEVIFSYFTLMKNNDSKEKNYFFADPVESYFECISSCDITDGSCISKCVAILRDNEN